MQVVKLTKAKFRDHEVKRDVLCTNGPCLAILPNTQTSCSKCGCPTVIKIDYAVLAGYVELTDKRPRAFGEAE